MDLHKTRKSCLSKTSRVNDKILEYYNKFGQDRDLEKFMRLHSPKNMTSCSSSESTSTSSSSCGEVLSKAMHKLLVSKNSRRGNVSERRTIASTCTEKPDMEQKVECIIPIILEEDEERESKTYSESTSHEDSSITPTKDQRNKTNPVKTPDSIAKSHKRLEWDSLGDVGYIKSMSASNISILERSILREFFQETSTTSVSNKTATNASEGDLHKKSKKELYLDDNRFRKILAADKKAIPLASSTFLEGRRLRNGVGGNSNHTTETSVSKTPKQQERYVQTSVPKAPYNHSREVQVNRPDSVISCSADESSSKTRSSLEYAFAPCLSNDEIKASIDRGPVAHNKNSTGIKDMISERQPLADRNNTSDTRSSNVTNRSQPSPNIVESVKQEKENALGMPQLDLGIQLLCSLIDAKSLGHKEKKRLVRDIVKRITQLGIDVCDFSDSRSSNSNPTERKNKAAELVNQNTFTKHQRNTDCSRKIEQAYEKGKPSDRNDYSSIRGDDENTPQVHVFDSPLSTSVKALQTQGEPSEKSETKADKFNINFLADSKSSTTTTGCSSSTTSSDLAIEKAAREKTSSSDSDATMNEWLNPLTQSEIEYEQRKRELAVQLEHEKQRQVQRAGKPDKEREVQLSWINTEIQRLESLRNLLQQKSIRKSLDNEDKSHVSGKRYGETLQVVNDKGPKLYDQVYSEPENLEEKSSTTVSTKESTEHSVQEIEVIIEESNEDEVNFQTNTKRVKERRRETQIIYDNPKKEREVTAIQSGKPRFRTMKETITIHEDQVLPVESTATAPAAQRSKIDTPPSSNESESVSSFVQQRKRDFMEHYKNKKKNQQEILQKQTKETQISTQNNPNPPTEAIQAASDHYSVPNSARRHSQSQQHDYKHDDDNMQPQHSARVAVESTHSLPKPHSSYSIGVASVSTSSSNTHTTSSMFAISSEVSIPMGSSSTSSTTTTTHQYDDVAVGGFMPPITCTSHSRRSQKNRVTWQRERYPSISQVNPKSIAYVISFNTASTTAADTGDAKKLTLQQHLQLGKPKFCSDSKDRKAILNKMQALRQDRERKLRDIVENTSLQSLDRKLTSLPPPPTKHTRIVSTKEMKAITNKHYARLPEVLSQQESEREQRRRRANRIILDVFNKRLQKRVRKGKLSLNHSRTVI